MQLKNKNVIYFDGHCGLCNFFVDFLINRDHSKKLYFCPLQKTPLKLEHFDSVILETNGTIYRESEAAIRAIALLGGPWKVAIVLLIVPKFISDICYRLISKNRYKFVKKLPHCRLPSSSQRDRFL